MTVTSIDRSADDYPAFLRVVELVSKQNPLQRKRIEAFISAQDDSYWTFAEELCQTLGRSFLADDDGWNEAARSYNKMCMDILREQIRFKEAGTYLLADASAAEEAVYSRPEVMRYYIVGLLFSYLFWPNHYQMWRMFKEHLDGIEVQRCLEVGAGHGLFTAEVMRRFPGLDLTIVDISETSIEVSHDMLKTFGEDPGSARTICDDYMTVDLGGDAFDFLIMGEVLEHVDDAPGFLRRAYELMTPGGSMYMSTCANCPAVDHVYHFHTVDEIRELITAAGLNIAQELALPAEAVPEEDWERELVTINYSAILTRDD